MESSTLIIFIKALTEQSTDCKQEIHHICNVNALTPFSSWTDVNGQKNRYWNGNHTSNTEGCECFNGKSCHSGFLAARNIDYKCKCDTYLPDAEDHGILRSTLKLPVMMLHYGGSITPYSSINYKLGPLICAGKKTFYPSELSLQERTELKQKIAFIESTLTEMKNETRHMLQTSLKVWSS